ncbi:MarR family winged helix-turn-helix transcriptional regulator [Nocardioides cheoyonin]|uniref:MarR family winged helix-turn-helix transcriptional regulator n=1 Tax=Nocardioides cheoyonin TaxID=3156615 RepID=UPI0032B3321A
MQRSAAGRRPAGADTTATLRRLLHTVERQVAEAMRINLDPAGLSVEDWAVLSLVSDGKGHTMAEVIDAAGVPAASATRLVDRLVSSALLHRTPDAQDRRRVLVALAPRGREKVAKLAPGQRRLAELLASRLGEGGMDALVTALTDAQTALARD